MAYLLYYQDEIQGCYGTVDLLRMNILILLTQLLKDNLVNKVMYQDLLNYLDLDDFTEENLMIDELNQNLYNLDLRIKKIIHETNGKCALEHILEHIKYRFDQLNEIMMKDVRVKTTFPGESAKEHNLGPMYYEQWKLLDNKNWQILTKTMHNYITERIEDLTDSYPDRIKFADVLYQNASETSYQVWSANALNWHREPGQEIPGEFQAKEMKFQEPGVFGIVVNPRYGYKNTKTKGCNIVLIPEEISKF